VCIKLVALRINPNARKLSGSRRLVILYLLWRKPTQGRFHSG